VEKIAANTNTFCVDGGSAHTNPLFYQVSVSSQGKPSFPEASSFFAAFLSSSSDDLGNNGEHRIVSGHAYAVSGLLSFSCICFRIRGIQACIRTGLAVMRGPNHRGKALLPST
jgi:hypothetical protein